MMAMNPKTLRPRKKASFHAEALLWQTAVIANGGTVSSGTMQAVSNFCTSIVTAGIRSKFLRLNLVCGNNLAAARTPLYRGASATGTQYGSAADTNIGPLTSGDYSEATGLQGNGSTKALDCTITLGTFKTFGTEYDNVHLSVYNRSLSGVSGPSFGAYDYNSAYLYNGVAINSSSGGYYTFTGPDFTSGSINPGDHDLSATSFARGFHLAEYTAISAGFYGINGANVTGTLNGTTATPFDAADATPLYFLGDFTGYSAQLLSAYSCGLPMTTTANRLAFATTMTAFQTALGRNVT
jgi:hypothetical protein